MVEDDGAKRIRVIAECQDWQLRIERPCRAHDIFARSDPVDLSIVEQFAAVLSHGCLTSEMKEEPAFLSRQRRIGILHGFDHRPPDAGDKRWHRSVVVQGHGARRMMRVRAIDEDMGGRNADGLLDFFDHRIEILPRHHQHVIGDDRELPERLLCQDHSHGAQLALAPFRPRLMNAAGDNHGIVSFEFHGGRAHADAKPGLIRCRRTQQR